MTKREAAERQAEAERQAVRAEFPSDRWGTSTADDPAFDTFTFDPGAAFLESTGAARRMLRNPATGEAQAPALSGGAP